MNLCVWHGCVRYHHLNVCELFACICEWERWDVGVWMYVRGSDCLFAVRCVEQGGGTRCAASFLNMFVLLCFSLTNNNIRAAGAMYLAQCLERNATLTTLK